MQPTSNTKVIKERRDYNSWVATETLEDYALRFAPKSFRKWSEALVANTALGGISFLALEAIGGSLVVNYGFTNSFWAIIVVSITIFLAGFPITYYASKYNIDMDLLTRGAGFGYIGSTITSLIYASFTFIFFALEAAIMAQALELYFHLPLAWGYILCSLIIIPLVFFGVTLINQLQLWTQPIWLILMIVPYIAVIYKQPEAISNWFQFSGRSPSGSSFDPLLFGAAATVSFSLIAQLGEQVDYLRFLPDQEENNRKQWWLALVLAGPGWIILGCAKQLGGAFLATLAVNQGVILEKANEPTQMYLAGFKLLFDNPETALTITILFVVISQIKINVTNAYAGSLAWSNFFSRLTHSHPGRVVWLIFNVAIALLLMELGVFSTLEAVLGLYSNVAIAWVGALVADLVINKPLKISPSYIEFKRAYLYNINPVGFGSMSIASVISIIAFVGGFGKFAQAFAPFIALGVAFVLSPLIAILTKGKYYIARPNIYLHNLNSHASLTCCICSQDYELRDMAYCPIYEGSICSLCCSLDARCHDACKSSKQQQPQIFREISKTLTATLFQNKISPQIGERLLKFLTIFGVLAGLVWVLFAWVYYQQAVAIANYEFAPQLKSRLAEIYAVLLIIIAMGSWWFVLTEESRQLAEEELDKQNLQLQQEVKERQQAESKLQEKAEQLEQTLTNLKQAEAYLIQTEKMAALGGLVAGIAHEINTPIGIGVTSASLLVEKTNTLLSLFEAGKMKRSDLEKYLDTAIQSGTLTLANLTRAAELIQSFKQVAVDQSSESKREFMIKSYLEEILIQLSPKLKASSHNIQLQGEAHLSLNSYPGAFSQIITNLLINSLTHAYKPGQQGMIKITFTQDGDRIDLEYTDNGQGIAPEHLHRIFEPFFTTKRGQGGSGLGLHIVYNLVTQKLRGTIRCESQWGAGVKFMMTLPNVSENQQ